MKTRFWTAWSWLGCASLGCASLGCASEPAPTEAISAEPAPSVASGRQTPSENAPPTEATEPRHFGSAIDEAVPMTTLDAIVSDPTQYDDAVVHTRGRIHRVCQRAGCWMELTARPGGPAVRVPMAGHSFFLPRDVSGRRAEIQGRVVVAELPPDMQEHLASEGATATTSRLSIHATGVRVF